MEIFSSKKIFSITDQEIFGQISGDFNPLHFETLEARRSQYGNPIVHGINLVLWALHNFPTNYLERFGLISGVEIIFKRPLILGEEASAVYSKSGRNKFTILLKYDNLVISKIRIATSSQMESINDKIFVEKTSHKFNRSLDNARNEGIPKKIFFEKYFIDLELLNKTYPKLINHFNLELILDLIRTTQIVGMEFPGLYSLFSQLYLSRAHLPKADKNFYTIKSYDERFSLYHIDYNSNSFSGVIKAFKRPKQFNQPNFHNLSKVTKLNEFAQQKALVIGASRGLGELAAKILVAGGADVTGTFYRGQTDAQRIIKDIENNNKQIKFSEFNALESIHQNPLIFESINSLYFFATPAIFVSQKKTMSYSVLHKFMKYYVIAFCQTVESLCQNSNSSRISIYYPSTEAVSTHPTDMAEYTIAKQAGELSAEYLSKKYSSLIIYKPRIPRMHTDQTSSPLLTELTDSQDYMLKSLREFSKTIQRST